MTKEKTLELISKEIVRLFTIYSFDNTTHIKAHCWMYIERLNGTGKSIPISKSTFDELRRLNSVKMKLVFINGVKQ